MMAGRARQASKRAEFERTQRAAKYVLSKTKLRPKIGVVLGSGLGALAAELAGGTSIPYAKIPRFPKSTVEGHAGNLVIGKLGDIPVAAMKGRVHYYEGYSAKDVAFPMRVFRHIGIEAVILTNAAGAVNGNYRQGSLVLIRDHINLQGMNPLRGPNDPRFGPRFPDMTEAYCKKYRAIACTEANRLGIPIQEGIYAALGGPSYETPAEIRMLKIAGADLVGMSTVPEVIAARHMGLRVLGISCVTNMAAGILDQEIDHAEVMETGNRVKEQFAALLRAVVPRIAADLK